MNTEVASTHDFSVMEQVVIQGRLEHLKPEERVVYYKQVCESVGLNPLTKPFEYITLNGKLTLYATRAATDQLRKLNGVSIQIINRETTADVYVVTAQAQDRSGRTDESIGAMFIKGLVGEGYANAIMKAETKAKRRATLSICGLGFLDESEIDGAVAAPFTNGQAAAIAQAARPKIEDSPERKALIETLEQMVLHQGVEALVEHWKTGMTKAQRTMVGKDEMERIAELTEAQPDEAEA